MSQIASYPQNAADFELDRPLVRLLAEIAYLEADLKLLECGIPRLMEELRQSTQPMLETMVEQRRQLLHWLGSEYLAPSTAPYRKMRLASLMVSLVAIVSDRFGVDICKDLEPYELKARKPEEHLAENSPEPSERPRKRHVKEKVDPVVLSQKLYHGLARELHPDKVSDQEERKERTQVMQRLNAAYHQGDFRTLLDILHLHGSAVQKPYIDADALKYLTKALNAQRDNLRSQVLAHLRSFASVAGNWKEVLNNPEKWHLIMQAQSKSGRAEIERMDRMVTILKKPNALSNILEEAAESGWKDLF